MARSYKKSPVIKKTNKFLKKQANKKVRKFKKVLNFASYKRVFNSWDIVSVQKSFSFEDYLDGDKSLNTYNQQELAVAKNSWERDYIRK